METVMKLTQILIVASISVIGLAACGGSGSDANNPPPVLTMATFDSGNATMITATAAEAALESVEIGSLTDLTGPTAALQGGVNKADSLSAAVKIAQGALGAVNFVPVSETTMCAINGSVKVTIDLAIPTTIAEGDTITIESTMCEDVVGEIVDGLLVMTITDIAGDIFSDAFLFGVDLVVTSLKVTASGETTTANGDIGTTIDTRTPPVIEGSVFGEEFTVSGMGKTESIMDFSTIYTEDTSTFPVSWTNNSMGRVSSSEFTGPVNYETPVTFLGSGENYPHTGELLVTGADNATLRLIVVDDGVTQVEPDYDVIIEADYDGINGVDETLFLTWAELAQ